MGHGDNICASAQPLHRLAGQIAKRTDCKPNSGNGFHSGPINTIGRWADRGQAEMPATVAMASTLQRLRSAIPFAEVSPLRARVLRLLMLGALATAAQAAYLGFQPAVHGLPAFAVRRHLVLGTSALPDGDFYIVDAIRSPAQQRALNLSEVLPDGFNSSASCAVNAQRLAEPMSALYERRPHPPRPLPGGVPRAFYRWPGNVTREQYDAVPYSQRGPLCGHCTNFVTYKIMEGQLYRGPEPDAYPDMARYRKTAEDMLLVVLYLWELPDMDFKLHFGDGCPTDAPAFSWNVCRHKAKGGFTMPSASAWGKALGPLQTQVFHACLDQRYPTDSRRPVAFWRGTNTDTNLVDNFTGDDYRQAARIRLHMDFQPTEETRIDAQLSSLIFADSQVKAAVGRIAPSVAMEEFNHAAVILDLDGNGWSDRWARIIHYNTFVLKQASNYSAFFEHLLGAGPVGFFRNDLSDLQQVVDRTLLAWREIPKRVQGKVLKRQTFAAALLHQMGVAEAMGHSLMVYHSKVTWKTVMEPNYTLVPFRNACHAGCTSLPAELCTNVRSYKAQEQAWYHFSPPPPASNKGAWAEWFSRLYRWRTGTG